MKTYNLPRNIDQRISELRKQTEEETAEINRCMHERFVISSEVIMYSIDDVMKITGWSKAIVQRLFRNPAFPSIDFGKQKLVEAHALIEYMSVKHEREKDPYWRKCMKKTSHR